MLKTVELTMKKQKSYEFNRLEAVKEFKLKMHEEGVEVDLVEPWLYQFLTSSDG